MLSRENAKDCNIVVISHFICLVKVLTVAQIFGKHMNVLTVHILIVLVMSVLNVSGESDPTFEWALNFGRAFNLGMADPLPKLSK